MGLTNRTKVMLGVAACGAVARLPGVYDRPFWEDEVASARVLSEPSLGALIHRVAHTESTPPLWYVLAWAVHVAGAPLREERLLSVLFGALLAAGTVALARRFVSLPLAGTAGLLIALGGEFVTHGHELRAYELFALLSLLFGFGLVRAWEARSRSRDVALAASVALGGSTHYFFAYSVLATLAWLWLDPRVRAVRTRLSLSIAVGGAIAAVWAPLMLVQYRHNRFSWIGPFRIRYVVAVPLRLFTEAWNNTTVGAVLSTAAIVLVVIGCRRLVATTSGTAVAVLAVAPLVAGALAWLAGSNTFDLRNLIGIGPFVATAAVSALDPLPLRVSGVAATAVSLALVVSLALYGGDHLPRFDRIAQTLVRAGWNGREAIAVFGRPTLYESPLGWYLPHQPRLRAAHTVPSSCGPVFVVHPSGRVTVVRGRPGRWLVGQATLLFEPGRKALCTRGGTERSTWRS
jgi:hypothetical protein